MFPNEFFGYWRVTVEQPLKDEQDKIVKSKGKLKPDSSLRDYENIPFLREDAKGQNGVSKGADYFGSGYPFINYTNVYNNIELPQELKGLAKSTDEDRISYSVKKGDIFFTRTSETVEEIGIASTCLQTMKNAIFSGFLIRFRPFNSLLFTEFSKYYFRSYVRELFFVKEMNLVTRASLSQELLKKLPVILPPLEEQKMIARFLDSKTAEIDKLIAQKERLIELYEEEKTAIINQAVTKGINPDVKLKPSGIDWLGDIPEHWEVKKLKHLVTKVGRGITPKGGADVYQLEGIPLLRSQNVYFDGLRLDDVAYISEQIHHEMSNSHRYPTTGFLCSDYVDCQLFHDS